MSIAEHLKTVPEAASVRVTAAGQMTHECPHFHETDHGTVAITWTCEGATVELHSLAAYLDAFDGERISHEAITDQIATDLNTLPGIRSVTVVSKWLTAGLEVRIEVGL